MEKISDKNLICIILTIGLALFTIGNAFHAGNWVLGFETLFMWLVLYSFQPMSKVIDAKVVCAYAEIDFVTILKRTISNRYIFISFCAALLLSMIFDDTLNYLGRFIEDNEFYDVLIVCAVVLFSSFISLSFYYLVSKLRLEKLVKDGEKVSVFVEKVKFFNNKYFIVANIINPLTNKKQRIISQIYAKTKNEIPNRVTIYFDKKSPQDYFLNANE